MILTRYTCKQIHSLMRKKRKGGMLYMILIRTYSCESRQTLTRQKVKQREVDLVTL